MDAGAAPGKIHRALADEHRTRIVDELQRAPHGLDAYELAERLGLHPNTIRWHLGILADAVIVSSRPEGRGKPGRPRILYTLSDDTGDSESYHLLATILAGALDELEDGSARAEAAGRAWGRYLVKRPRQTCASTTSRRPHRWSSSSPSRVSAPRPTEARSACTAAPTGSWRPASSARSTAG